MNFFGPRLMGWALPTGNEPPPAMNLPVVLKRTASTTDTDDMPLKRRHALGALRGDHQDYLQARKRVNALENELLRSLSCEEWQALVAFYGPALWQTQLRFHQQNDRLMCELLSEAELLQVCRIPLEQIKRCRAEQQEQQPPLTVTRQQLQTTEAWAGAFAHPRQLRALFTLDWPLQRLRENMRGVPLKTLVSTLYPTPEALDARFGALVHDAISARLHAQKCRESFPANYAVLQREQRDLFLGILKTGRQAPILHAVAPGDHNDSRWEVRGSPDDGATLHVECTGGPARKAHPGVVALRWNDGRVLNPLSFDRLTLVPGMWVPFPDKNIGLTLQPAAYPGLVHDGRLLLERRLLWRRAVAEARVDADRLSDPNEAQPVRVEAPLLVAMVSKMDQAEIWDLVEDFIR